MDSNTPIVSNPNATGRRHFGHWLAILALAKRYVLSREEYITLACLISPENHIAGAKKTHRQKSKQRQGGSGLRQRGIIIGSAHGTSFIDSCGVLSRRIRSVGRLCSRASGGWG